MLVLTRRKDESLVIGDNIIVTIVDVRGDTIRIGVEAPKDVSVHRLEIYRAIQEENCRAAESCLSTEIINNIENLLNAKK